MHGHDQVTLVLGRQEGGRDARQSEDGDPDEREREHDHQGGAARHRADEPCIAALGRAVGGVEAAREEIALFGRFRRPEPQRGLRGLQGHGVDGADESGGGDHERELPVELSGEAREKGGGNEHRHEHERDAEDRTCQVVHRPARGLAAGQPLLDIARDALDDDDRVVDHDPDRQHEGEEGRKVDRETQRRHGGERADQSDRNGGRRHEHRPPVLQEDEDDDQHQDGGLDQRPIDLEDRGPHEFRRVVGDDVSKPLREALGEFVHFRLHLVGDGDGVGVRQEGDGDARGGLAIEF